MTQTNITDAFLANYFRVEERLERQSGGNKAIEALLDRRARAEEGHARSQRWNEETGSS